METNNKPKKYYGSYVGVWKTRHNTLRHELDDAHKANETLVKANMCLIEANAKLVQELGEVGIITRDLSQQIETQAETIEILLEQLKNLKKIKGL